MPILDSSFVRAVPVRLPAHSSLSLVLVGCGGTGGWLAPSLARIAYLLKEQKLKVSVTFIDPDVVESDNVPRQNFCPAELGLPKAQTLALRYGTAWGVDIAAIQHKFKADHLPTDCSSNTIVIGCVDNYRARAAIHHALIERSKRSYLTTAWYIDCGNSKDAGQVLLGSVATLEQFKEKAFPGTRNHQAPQWCCALPLPGIQHPELLVADSTKKEPQRRLSCAELMALNAQSLTINQRIADEAADYLYRLLFSRDLKRFATYVNFASGSSSSRYITPKELAKIEWQSSSQAIA